MKTIHYMGHRIIVLVDPAHEGYRAAAAVVGAGPGGVRSQTFVDAGVFEASATCAAVDTAKAWLQQEAKLRASS
ncbi:hypothetical protein [Piscinibacter koreensis]|uniref:Uncharacterized protein n=1 Tax=Piscinibacter koreensis TaxID=2742824 RepID=A0A7Y6NTF4_9BURK|nr:hypothetical protein [Schlegelella koreensis]NUZ09000.1 hypothetical protein [Schlegelella koreensis]